MTNRIDSLQAPLLVSWQLTRDCDLACLHCCTESAPGKRLPDELSEDEAMCVVAEIVSNNVPYVMLCGGEPLVVPHFLRIAEKLGEAGIRIKLETNGQRFDARTAERLAALPMRSIQVSLDGDSQQSYERQRPGGSLAKAHAACRAIRAAGIPLEITFVPTQINFHEVEAVIHRARELGAFRFNSGQLMRIGTAARQWRRLDLSDKAWSTVRALFAREAEQGGMEICYEPFTMQDGLRRTLSDPPATLLVLPNGWVKVAAALPHICADLRRCSLTDAWKSYQRAWHDISVSEALLAAATDAARHSTANTWRILQPVET